MHNSCALRCGHATSNDRGREVLLTYGRRGGRTELGQGELFQVPHDLAPWGGSEILPRRMAAHFAEAYIKLLTGRDLSPDMLLGDGVSMTRWEAKIDNWVYFIELAWAIPDQDYKPGCKCGEKGAGK